MRFNHATSCEQLQIPLELGFHKIDKSAWAEAEIRARVDRLTMLYSGLTGCRVHVDQTASRKRTPPVVHIEMSIPGAADLVVAYEPERLLQRYQNPGLREAISDAFAAAERQLVDFKRRREGGKMLDLHDQQNRFHGQIAEMYPEQDYGYLLTKEGGLLYFHRNSVLDTDFNTLKPGDDVHYIEVMGDTGPTAAKVRVIAGSVTH